MDPGFLFDLIERQLADGLNFLAIHCGINQFSIERLRCKGFRNGGLVSMGVTLSRQLSELLIYPDTEPTWSVISSRPNIWPCRHKRM
jgi:hypothetical protein